jgi:hypothetical protein
MTTPGKSYCTSHAGGAHVPNPAASPQTQSQHTVKGAGEKF